MIRYNYEHNFALYTNNFWSNFCSDWNSGTLFADNSWHFTHYTRSDYNGQKRSGKSLDTKITKPIQQNN